MPTTSPKTCAGGSPNCNAKTELSASSTSEDATDAGSETTYANIAPKLTTQWNQNAPYNVLCPTFTVKTKDKKDSTFNAPTGCMATALAQIMYYKKWPIQGQGSIKYLNSSTNDSLSCDFSKSTYDWDHMNVANYDSTEATAEQIAAVARLMVDVGYALQTEYGKTSSGSTGERAPYALVHYFGYDVSTSLRRRDNYTADQWQEMIYNELRDNGPVYYEGLKPNLSGGAGHAFVLDGYCSEIRGYKGNFYHINWGWSGLSNGYFLLTNLSPASRGTGSGGSTGSYNLQQSAIIGMKKPTEGQPGTFTPEIYFTEAMKTEETNTKASSESSITFATKLVTYDCQGTDVQFGLKLTDENEANAQYIEADQPQTVTTTIGGTDNPMTVTIKGLSHFPTTTNQEVKQYRLRPAYKVAGTSVWRDCYVNSRSWQTLDSTFVLATVSGSDITLKRGGLPAPLVAAEVVETPETIVTGKPFAVKVALTAKNRDVRVSVAFKIVYSTMMFEDRTDTFLSLDGNSDLLANNTDTLTMHFNGTDFNLEDDEITTADYTLILQGFSPLGTYRDIIADLSKAEGKLKLANPTAGIRSVTTEAAMQKGIFNLSGQRITRPTHPGIYIIDGRKKAVK